MKHRYPKGIPEYLRKECEVCNCQGNSLTSDCKGEPLTDVEALAVRSDLIDYVNGAWLICDYTEYLNWRANKLKAFTKGKKYASSEKRRTSSGFRR